MLNASMFILPRLARIKVTGAAQNPRVRTLNVWSFSVSRRGAGDRFTVDGQSISLRRTEKLGAVHDEAWFRKSAETKLWEVRSL